MSKAIKAMMTAGYRARYADVASACVVDLAGLDVQAQESLRRLLREKSAKVEVLKNRLARVAFQDSALEPIGEVLEGPCALVTAEESIIDAAKALVAAAKEFDGLTLKQAMFDGDRELLSIDALAKMKGRLELIAEIAGLVRSPGAALAGCLKSPPSKIAGCLTTLSERAA